MTAPTPAPLVRSVPIALIADILAGGVSPATGQAAGEQAPTLEQLEAQLEEMLAAAVATSDGDGDPAQQVVAWGMLTSEASMLEVRRQVRPARPRSIRHRGRPRPKRCFAAGSSCVPTPAGPS